MTHCTFTTYADLPGGTRLRLARTTTPERPPNRLDTIGPSGLTVLVVNWMDADGFEFNIVLESFSAESEADALATVGPGWTVMSRTESRSEAA